MSTIERERRVSQLRDALAERVLVLDGAMGTSIQNLGLGEADFREGIADGHPDELFGNNDFLSLT
ncbi:MAG: 5-methyltetrahydrofolate--homocysteine methyltransferase, partial [Acidimicrobiales bacterium]